MADEPENLTLKLLREMRAEIKERDELIAAELSAIRSETAHIPGIAAEVAALGVQAEEAVKVSTSSKGALFASKNMPGL